MARALFLDRDGVINIEKNGSYIFTVDEFQFCNGALTALTKASKVFDYLIVVTNQRGVGRGYMSEIDLKAIHQYLRNEVTKAGGQIDAIYYATSVDSNHTHRKPNTGMALDALSDFPDIEFKNSVMIGNNLSDMQFGKNMQMETIFLSTTQAPISMPHYLIDKQFESLADWALTEL